MASTFGDGLTVRTPGLGVRAIGDAMDADAVDETRAVALTLADRDQSSQLIGTGPPTVARRSAIAAGSAVAVLGFLVASVLDGPPPPRPRPADATATRP